MEHHTKEKGDIGLYAVQLDLSKKKFKVFTSNSEHVPFDIIAYKENGVFLRIQVKYRKAVRGKIDICSRTSWTDKNGTHTKAYDKKEIDFFAIYCPDTNKCYYMPIDIFNKAFSLRINDTKNNQKIGVNLAKDFEDLAL